jgi:uncharacterized membrane protein YphA (DoxX/SURF4 family)
MTALRAMTGVARLAGRAALATPFIVLGLDAAREPAGRVATVEGSGLPIPIATETAVKLNAGVMIAGGAAMALGLRPRLAALAVLASLIPTTYAGHRYWEVDEEAPRRQQRIHFMKNVAMAGGLLFVAATKRRQPAD